MRGGGSRGGGAGRGVKARLVHNLKTLKVKLKILASFFQVATKLESVYGVTLPPQASIVVLLQARPRADTPPRRISPSAPLRARSAVRRRARVPAAGLGAASSRGARAAAVPEAAEAAEHGAPRAQARVRPHAGAGGAGAG